MCSFSTLSILAVLAAFLAFYSQYFETGSVVSETMQPGFTFGYVKRTGSFMQIPDAFTEIANLINLTGTAEPHVGVGVFFDDPAKVKTEEVRFWIGFVIPEGHPVKPHPNLTVHTLQQSGVVHATFPWNKYNVFAPMIGPTVMYPKLHAYIQETQGRATFQSAAVELYEEYVKIDYLIYQENFESLKWTN